MEIPWTTIGWIAGLVFVYLFGLFEGRGQGYKRRKAEEEEQKKDQPAPRPETIKVDDSGLLRIKNENGSLVLDLDGSRVNTSSLSTEHRKRLVELLTVMRPWLEGKPAAAPPATPAGSSLESRLNAISAPPPPKPPDQPQYSPDAPREPRPASVPAPAPAPRPGTIAKEDRPSLPANSMIGQIDVILQSRLVGTHLEDRGIFLAQSPEGGVNVYVGLTRYAGIDEVPDPDIKAIIRAAITEWERKYTPGL
jgi:hypothetical protein